MSTDTPLVDGPVTRDAGGSAAVGLEDLAARTQALAGAIAAACSTGTAELLAGPADAQDGPEDLLPPGPVHGVIATVRESHALQVVLLLGELIAEAGAEGADDDAPAPWLAPVTAAMERWAAEQGGTLVNAMPVEDANQLRHLLISAADTTLVASGLFAGNDLAGSVAVVGRATDGATDAADAPAAPPAATTHATTGAAEAPTADAARAGSPRASSMSPAVAAMHVLAEVEMKVTAELGRTRMSVSELLALAPGSLIELDRTAGSPIDLLVNGTLIARGEVVVVDEEYGIRLTEITGTPEA